MRTTLSQQDIRAHSSSRNDSNYGNGFHGESVSKKISSAAYMFRDSERCFSGTFDSSASFHRFKKLYNNACAQYFLPDHTRINLLAQALSGIALDFYLENIQDKTTDIIEAFQILEKRFDSQHARAQAQSYLESQTIASIREEKNCSTTSAMEIAQRRIHNVIPMCESAFRDDSHKGRILAHMLCHESWAQPCSAMRMTQAQSYKTFVAALNSSLTQRSISELDSSSISKDKPGMANVNWYGQKYAATKASFAKRRRLNPDRPRRSFWELQNLKARTRCLKFNQVGHWRAECPHHNLSMTDAIESRIRTPESAHNYLLAMTIDEDEHSAYVLDCEAAPENEQGNENAEADPFDALIASLVITGNYQPIGNYADINYVRLMPSIEPAVNNSYISIHLPPFSCYNLDDYSPFRGGLVDAGAHRSVIGKQQAMAYFEFAKQSPSFTTTKQIYRFGETITSSHQALEIVVPTPNDQIMLGWM